MKKLFTRAAIASGACLFALTPALAFHSWGGYHWARAGSEVSLKVNTAISSAWSASVGTAITDWHDSGKLALTAQAATGINPKTCNPIAGQVLVCNAAYGQRGWLGIASIWLSNGHISQATTKLNDSYFTKAFYNTPAWRSAVACQEIGHDFGLDHQDEAFDNYNLGSCMDYSRNPAGGRYNGIDYGPSNEHPNKHDYDELDTIYGHIDSSASAAAAAATDFGIREVGKAPPVEPSAAGAGDGPSEWGRAIHRDSEGRPDVFAKDLGGGRKVITHVLWAFGEGPQR
jgi:hypothetical protein